MDRDLRLDLLVEPHLDEVDVDQLAAHGMELLVLHDDRARFAVELQVDQCARADEDAPQLARVRSEADDVALGRAVDDARHESLLAHAARDARAVLGARADLDCRATTCHERASVAAASSLPDAWRRTICHRGGSGVRRKSAP